MRPWDQRRISSSGALTLRIYIYIYIYVVYTLNLRLKFAVPRREKEQCLLRESSEGAVSEHAGAPREH